MKCSGLWLGVLAASLLSAGAQVSVEVVQDQDAFLEGEALHTLVRVTNRSGRTLHLGDQPNWLIFNIESESGAVVPKLSEVRVLEPFDLESSKMATRKVNLAPYFEFPKPGRYKVVATVHVPGWDQEFSSPDRFFSIISGTRLWEQEFGVPAAAGSTNAAPEVRKFMLHQANYIKGALRLYMQLVDSNGRILQVYPIGRLLSFSHPEPRLDKDCNLHVLYQNGPQTFSYTCFGVDGKLLVRQTYEIGEVRPRLVLTDAGQVQMVGGLRRVMPDDVPVTRESLPEGTPVPLMPPPLQLKETNVVNDTNASKGS